MMQSYFLSFLDFNESAKKGASNIKTPMTQMQRDIYATLKAEAEYRD